MEKYYLHGQWKRIAGNKLIGFQNVPGTYLPCGQCTLEYEFTLPWDADAQHRYFLVTEGLMAEGTFMLNGEKLGTAGPFCRYRFEIPAGQFNETNTVSVIIKDLDSDFGTTPGRLFEAGLNRPIYIEKRPSAFIKDFLFQYKLNEDLSSASCKVVLAPVEVGYTPSVLMGSSEVNGDYSGNVEAILINSRTGKEAARAEGTGDTPIEFRVNGPELWSPDTPNLYNLTVSLSDNGDTLTEQVGFRKIEIRKQDFFLNNKRLILKGVCRHEFTSRSGYSPSYEETYSELAMIKNAGFNYIRLVHSPQSSEVCRIAAELGIFVSEEPGTCWHNLGDEVIAAPAVEALRRTVKRDRNVPSIFAWLIYNECDPNVDYAVRIGKMVRELHPGCLLSTADCSGKEEDIKEMVQKAELSYYGINQYGMAPRNYVQTMDKFTDRPLVFTEWGGCNGQGSRRILENLCKGWVTHTREQEEHRAAGCAFWVWADYPERSRARFAAPGGWTIEGLIDKKGNTKEDLQILSQMCGSIDNPLSDPPYRLEILSKEPVRSRWEAVLLEKVSTSQEGLESRIGEMRGAYRGGDFWFVTEPLTPFPPPRFGRILCSGIDFHCRDAEEHEYPLILGKENPELVIPVDRDVREIAVLGNIAFKGGYPGSDISSVFHKDAEAKPSLGQNVAEYEFIFEDRSETVPLRHGIEVLRSNLVCRWWDTDPVSEALLPAVRAEILRSHEVLRAYTWEYGFEEPGLLKEIRWRLKDERSILFLYALSVRC